MTKANSHDAIQSPQILASLRRALEEDIGSGDVTTGSIIAPGTIMNGRIIAKQNGTVAGLHVAGAVFGILEPAVRFNAHVPDGETVANQQILATLSGPAAALLTGERTALNFLGRMSGIATLTRQYVDAVAGTKASILDTRKTAPGLRTLDKLSVVCGGGRNHRQGLHDMILIKDNHIDLAGSITEAVLRARRSNPHLELEVETRTMQDVSEALELHVGWILLDNMSLEDMRKVAGIYAGRVPIEVSGNVTLERASEIAAIGVDFISVGALTHSARALDISLEFLS
jgi:nicotinate-nucleotide pyrophosphorylase (carboxylating)